jgi:ComF family protein
MPSWMLSSGTFHTLTEYLQAFIHLFYPHICLQCGVDTLSQKQIICPVCESQLPYTNFSPMKSSPVDKIFWGRVSVDKAFSVLYFTKESIVQKIIFELKYKQNKRAGYFLGKLMANEMIQLQDKIHIDYLIPIPISKRKMRSRGYNQSKLLCEAMFQNGYQVPIAESLMKIKGTSTQTNKDRLHRGENTSPIFKLHPKINLANKHLLIVDDVLTTGATLEMACHCLWKAKPASIQIITAAYTIA